MTHEAELKVENVWLLVASTSLSKSKKKPVKQRQPRYSVDEKLIFL